MEPSQAVPPCFPIPHSNGGEASWCQSAWRAPGPVWGGLCPLPAPGVSPHTPQPLHVPRVPCYTRRNTSVSGTVRGGLYYMARDSTPRCVPKRNENMATQNHTATFPLLKMTNRWKLCGHATERWEAPATTWTNLENILLSERSQTQRTTYVIPFIGNVQTRKSRDRKVSGCPGLGLGTRGRDEGLGRRQLRGVRFLLGMMKIFPSRL